MKNRRSCHKRPAMQQRTAVAPLPMRPLRVTPLALAVAAALYPASFVFAQAHRQPGQRQDRRAAGSGRHGDPARDQRPERPAEHHRFFDGGHREVRALGSAGRHRRIAERQPGEQHARSQRDHHARRLDRLVRVPHRQPGLGVPRRPADDLDLAAGRRAPHRHRAHRIAAGPAGHAVRLELAGRHAALRHQQAGRHGIRCSVRPRGRHDQGRRAELRRQRPGQHSPHATTSRCARSASTPRRRLRRQRPRSHPARSRSQ